MSMNINDAIRVIQNKSPSLSKDELKSLKQSDRKILHSKLSESSLSKKEKANVIQLADKLQKNTFSKYVDGKEYRPSTRGEQVIKGIKQLVGGRISSEKLHAKLNPNGKVPEPVFKENPKFLAAKESELKQKLQEIEKKEVKLDRKRERLDAKELARKEVKVEEPKLESKGPKPRHMFTLNKLMQPRTRTPESMEKYLSQHKCFIEVAAFGLKYEDKVFISDAIKKIIEEGKLNPSERMEAERALSILGIIK